MENLKKIETRYENNQAKNLLPLTNREIEILGCIGSGKTNKEISKDLLVSPSTIRNHISTIFIKLKIKNRSQATAIAIRSGLVKFEVGNIMGDHIKEPESIKYF